MSALADVFFVFDVYEFRVYQLRTFTSAVSERGRDVHAHLQPHLYDATTRTLERLSPVPCAHVTRFPA